MPHCTRQRDRILPERKTQETKILELLIRARGGWVPAPDLAAVSLQYTARVYSLRRLGLAVENRVEGSQDGIRHGFFRLCTGSPRRPGGAVPAGFQAAPFLPEEDTPFLAFGLSAAAAYCSRVDLPLYRGNFSTETINDQPAPAAQPAPLPAEIHTTLPLFGDPQPERRCQG